MADVIIESVDDLNMIDVPLWMQAPAGEDAYPYSVNALRYLMRGYRATAPAGVGSGTDFAVTPGGSRTLDIAGGLGVTRHTDDPEERYVIGSFGTVTIAIPTYTSGTQTHRLVAETLDTQRTGITGDSRWRLRVIEGTGGVTPSEPANAISLATVTDTGQGTITTSHVVDQRSPFDATAPSVAISRAATQSIPRATATAITLTTQVDDPFNLWSATYPSRIFIRHKGAYNIHIQGVFIDLTTATDLAEIGFYSNGLYTNVVRTHWPGVAGGVWAAATAVAEVITPTPGWYLQPYAYWTNVAGGGPTTIEDVRVRVQRVQHRD